MKILTLGALSLALFCSVSFAGGIQAQQDTRYGGEIYKRMERIDPGQRQKLLDALKQELAHLQEKLPTAKDAVSKAKIEEQIKKANDQIKEIGSLQIAVEPRTVAPAPQNAVPATK